MVDDVERVLWLIDDWDRTYNEILQLFGVTPKGLEDQRGKLPHPVLRAG